MANGAEVALDAGGREPVPGGEIRAQELRRRERNYREHGNRVLPLHDGRVRAAQLADTPQADEDEDQHQRRRHRVAGTVEDHAFAGQVMTWKPNPSRIHLSDVNERLAA